MRKIISFFCAISLLQFISCGKTSDQKTNNQVVKEVINDSIAAESTNTLTADLLADKLNTFGHFKTSSNDNYILMSKENASGVYVYDKSQSKVIPVSLKALGHGSYIDGNTVYYKEKDAQYQLHVKSFNIAEGKEKKLNVSPNLLLSTINKDKIFHHNIKTLALEIYNEKGELIKSFKGEKNFYTPIFSPNHEYLVVHDGPNMKLFSTDGELLRTLGKGLATAWSPDSKKIAFFIDIAENHHEISNSELFLYDIETEEILQLTNTENAIEAYPYFLEGKLYFRDLKTETIKTMPYE